MEDFHSSVGLLSHLIIPDSGEGRTSFTQNIGTVSQISPELSLAEAFPTQRSSSQGHPEAVGTVGVESVVMSR